MIRLFRTLLTLAWIAVLSAFAAASPNQYEGKYCQGAGDVEFLRLIDESFAFFHPNPNVPSVSMLYRPDWDTFAEGANWNGWWVSNSHGFAYCSLPFLPEPFFGVLEQSNKMWYDGQADGKTVDRFGHMPPTIAYSKIPNPAPEGVMPECATPGGISGCEHVVGEGNYLQGDWSLTSTAAGIMLQAELLLVKRDKATILEYLPKMEKASAFLESRRDPKNGLLLAGPCATMQGSDYTGYRKPDGTYGKAYLSVLAVEYCAALERMVEFFRFVGDANKQKEYEKRWEISRKSLDQLLTPEGYLVRFIEPDGTKHGVMGHKSFGYFGALPNADAVALRIVDDAAAVKIYRQIAATPGLRPFDFLITNYPGLDDTHWNYGNRNVADSPYGHHTNGGAWGSEEGRAILMYYRLGKFEDVRRSATRAMKWAKDFRMDAPWSQWGENTHNVWSDTGANQVGGVAIMVDNFAIPAATVRGLFDYQYRFDRLILRPRIPGSITEYVQKQPVRFGSKMLYLSCRNGGPKIGAVSVNGKMHKIESPDAVALLYDELPDSANIEIVTEGGWAEPVMAQSQSAVVQQSPVSTALPDIPAALTKPYKVLTAMERAITSTTPEAIYERAFVRETLAAIEAARQRQAVQPTEGYFRPMTPKKREAIDRFYENTALRLYNGFAKRMAAYASSADPNRKQLADLFTSIQIAN